MKRIESAVRSNSAEFRRRYAHNRSLAAQLRQRESFAAGPWSERYDAIYRALLSARALSPAGQ